MLPSVFSAAIKLGCSQLCGLLQKVQALSALLVVVQRRPDTVLFDVVYQEIEDSSWFLLSLRELYQSW